jgi:hypothetical protein
MIGFLAVFGVWLLIVYLIDGRVNRWRGRS